MINIKINCDFCNVEFEEKTKAYPHNLLQAYGTLKNSAELKNWVYLTGNKRWYCPECAEVRNAYSKEKVSFNRNNMEGWHYTELNDFPPIVRDGITENVISQDGDEVWFSMRLGWLKADEMQQVRVYKWRYKDEKNS